MNTLIELYDERAIENVIGPETFSPERVIYLCPEEVMRDGRKKQILTDFFQKRGMTLQIEFVESSLYRTDKILHQLEKIGKRYGDCVIDITGGTDAAVFAAGMFCRETGTPAFTYSRKRQCFYNISNALEREEIPCTLAYRVEDFFAMTGGEMRKGRVDNSILDAYMDRFDAFFEVFLRFRKEWTDQVIYFQRVSRAGRDEDILLTVEADYTVKGERGSRVSACPGLLKALEEIGFLHDVEITEGERVSFRFEDEQIRAWLRDVGSVLELYMYKACRDTGAFGDVISSAIVDWDQEEGRALVSNEIDVVAARGVTPLFISCKACEVKTEALNELAILRDRFGGKGAKAAVATTERCTAAARHRAAQLGIAVIDLEELEKGSAAARLKVIMKVAEDMP